MKYGSYEIRTKSLKELFQAKEFSLPLYQRDYSWTKVQLEGFKESLEALMTITDDQYDDSRTTMFLSQFVFADSPIKNMEVLDRRNNDNRLRAKSGDLMQVQGLEIVDGQQRLTTLHIVIHCMLSKVDSAYHRRNRKTVSTSQATSALQQCQSQIGKINEWFLKEENTIDYFCENKGLAEKTRLFPDIHRDIWCLIFNNDIDFKAKKKIWNTILKEVRAKGYYKNSQEETCKLKDGDRKLWTAYDYFYNFFNGFDIETYTPGETDKFLSLWNKLLVNANTDETAAHSTELIAKRFEDGVFVFNALNTKNKQLSAADLVKMHAYELCMKNNDEAVRSEKAMTFMDDFNELESNEVFAKETDLVNYFRVYLVSKYGRKVKNIASGRYITISNSTLYKAYQSTIDSVGQMQNVFRELRNLLPIFEMIKNRSAKSINEIGQKDSYKKLSKTVERMNILLPSLSAFDHVLLNVFNKFKDRQTANKVYKYDDNIDGLQKIMTLIYKFSVRHYTICGERGNTVMTALDKEQKKLDETNDIEKYYEILSQALKKIQPSKKVFLEQFIEFTEKDNAKSKIMLWEIEEHMRSDHNDTSKFECEHIFPKDGHAKWKEDYENIFSDGSTIISNLKEKRFHLGNLTLLTRQDNNLLGDTILTDKLPYYLEGKGGYTLGIFELFHKAYKNNNQQWTDDSVIGLQELYAYELEKIFKVS